MLTLNYFVIVFVHQAAEYQSRRAEQKKREEARRTELLKQEPVDITPKNGGTFPWSDDDAGFDEEWSMKPVKVKGIFDHQKEMRVKKLKNGEKGAQVITPFYTHLDGKGEAAAILVNRGWLAQDLLETRQHYMTKDQGSIEGVLYRGDKMTKYTGRNSPNVNMFKVVKPSDLALVAQLPNEDQAGKVMLHMVDFDPEVRQILPDIPTPDDLN